MSISQFSEQQRICPVRHSPEPVTRTPDGVWHVRNFAVARAVLRDQEARQAGFGADAVRSAMSALNIRVSVLYQDGTEHLEQRRWVAKSFTPSMVSNGYQPMMEQVADRVVALLRRAGQGEVSELGLEMAVSVAAHIVGLTDSWWRSGLVRRLEKFFIIEVVPFSLRPKGFWKFLKMVPTAAGLYVFDVVPAMLARRRERRVDVISNLMDQQASSFEVLGECITYATAGMMTTREFISMALWHMLNDEAAREQYLAAPEGQRLEILREVLRLEPVISHVKRLTTTDVEAEGHVIPKDSMVHIHIHDINVDERTVGADPRGLCPERKLHGDRVPTEVIAFGDGRHRCPGEYVAIMEADVLLRRLLVLPGLRIVRRPDMSVNELLATYKLRGFEVAVDR